MEFLRKISAFVGNYVLQFVILVVAVFIYGRYDQFAGYLLFFVPIAAFIGSVLYFLIRTRFGLAAEWQKLLLSIFTAIAGFFIFMLILFALPS